MAEESFAKYCRENILRMCKSVSPNYLHIDEIKNQFRKLDPDNPAWEKMMIVDGKEMKDSVYRHAIGMECKRLLDKLELSNGKYEHYRYLTDEDRNRMHLDPRQVWINVIRNARTEALENNTCYGPKGEKQFTFVMVDNHPYIYTKTKKGRDLIKRDAVEQIVRSVNVEPDGRTQRGWKNLALRSAIIHCSDDLKFDGHGWITLDNNRSHIQDEHEESTEMDEESPLPTDIRGLVKNSMQRARGGRKVHRTRNRRKIPHDIDDEGWIAEKEKLTHCEVTGIEFTLDSRGPFQRSLDQRVPGMGYTKDNTDVVVLIYNYAKNEYESEEVLDFCKQFVSNKVKR